MTKRQIAAVIFDGFEMLDLYGPLEMFSMHPDAFQIDTVAASMAPVSASNGPSTVPAYTFDNAPQFDILLVPGGPGTRSEVNNEILLNWLSHQAEGAEIVSSVCTGSVLLARAGCLSGLRATTNKLAFDWVKGQAPDVVWQPRARWVKSGKFYTSSGVSAGIDMSLALIADLLGAQAADDAATWAEYTRNPDPSNDPFEIE